LGCAKKNSIVFAILFSTNLILSSKLKFESNTFSKSEKFELSLKT
jgi:hypothetical protein